MYYVVFTGNVIHYLGQDRHYASEVWTGLERGTLVNVASLEELRVIITAPELYNRDNGQMDEDDVREVERCCGKKCHEKEPDLSDAATRLFDKLDELGLSAENTDRWAKEFKENGDKVVAEVRSLGVKGMRAVGEGFKALGDLLKRESNEEEDEEFLRDLEDLSRRDDNWDRR